MEQVELKVKVIDSELNALQSKVNGLKNTTLKVDADGATESIKKYSDATKEAAKSSNSLLQNIGKFTTWYLIGGAVSGVIRSFKDAVGAIKEVDSALATVQKVTGESEAVIKRLGDTAYETASKYGVAAKDFLAAAGDFAKAGYDNYGAMAELATKVQLVGDVTADTASQFILSANAAWKMEGNITRLSAVLDAANEIENNYATSIEKIADGLPIVASTAANANMSMEEVIASLGTITAVTQESGTKAATALRALILNLQGAVGEYEEGFQVTEESVQSLNGLLNIYAADAMKAADAAGKIINPLEAIAALSKAAEEGLLNQAELFDLLSGLGGKLRTNQLTALVTNFDMLSSMLETVGTSAGSAERELDVMLNTWEAKTNQLKNSWTEFVQNFVNTEVVKGAITGFTDILNGINDVLGGAESEDGLTEKLGETVTRLQEINSLPWYERTPEIENERKALEKENEALQKQLDLIRKKGVDDAKDRYGYSKGVSTSEREYRVATGAYAEATFSSYEEAARMAKQWGSTVETVYKRVQLSGNDMVDYLVSGLSDLDDAMVENGGLTVDQMQLYSEYTDELKNYQSLLETLVANGYPEYQDKLNQVNYALEQSSKALDESKNYLNDHIKALQDEAEQAGLTGKALTEYVVAGINAINNTSLNVSDKIAALAALGNEAVMAYEKMYIAAKVADGNSPGEAMKMWGNEFSASGVVLHSDASVLEISSGGSSGGGGGASGGGGGGKATDPELDRRKGIVSLLKSELALYKERGDAQDVQIAKMREIQNALHDEAEYMRSIGASQEDINGLSEEWWKYENQIKDLQEEIIEDQKKQIENVKSLIEVYYKEQNTALSEQKDALEAARDAEKDRLTLAEKQLAVEKARAALENAQKERTVRQYNAATGQWEWVADQKTVESARSAYEKALKDLSDFQSDLEFQRQKAEIEQRIKLNENAASALENAIQVYIDAMLSGSDKTGEAFENLIETLKGANGLSDQLREQIIISLMKANAANWFTASDEMKAQLHGYNDQLGALIGANYNSSTGYWMKNGMRLFALDESATYETLGLAGSGGAGGSGIVISQGGLVNGNAPAGLPVGTVVQTAGGDFKIVAPGTEGARYNAESGYWSLKVHDIGGVLKGVGGIKATNEDELVLPPDITQKMLTPTLDANTRARFAELRYLYGGNKLAGVGGTSIGSQHNGNIYNLNGVNITERQAKATSVYDFVRMSQGLSIYNSTN